MHNNKRIFQTFNQNKLQYDSGVGQEGRSPEEMGQEAGEKRAGSMSPKVAGTGRN